MIPKWIYDGCAMRVMVTGGRDYKDGATVDAMLGRLNQCRPIGTIIHGDATGADALADRWATSHGVRVSAYPVDPKLDGPWPAAGPRRNGRMISASAPDLAVAFPGGRGTADAMRKIVACGIGLIAMAEVSTLSTGATFKRILQPTFHGPALWLQDRWEELSK